MTERFVTGIRDFLQREDIPLVRFQKGQCKDDIFKQRLKKFKAAQGVVFAGLAQEKARGPIEPATQRRPGKVDLASLLRARTTMTLKWIAQRLKMGLWTYVSNCLVQRRRNSKQCK